MIKPAYHRNAIVTLIAVVVLTCSGVEGRCGKGSCGDEAKPIQLGQWIGKADFGSIEFKLDTHDKIKANSFKAIFSEFCCGSVIYENIATQFWSQGLTILNHKMPIILINMRDTYGTQLFIGGKFATSGTYIIGTYELHNNAESCSGEWIAQPKYNE